MTAKTLELKDIVNAVILPEQKELIYQFDEVGAIETVLEAILVDVDQIERSALINGVMEFIIPIRDLLYEPNVNSLKKRVGKFVEGMHRSGLINIGGEMVTLTTDGEKWVKDRFELPIFKEFANLLRQINRLRNLL